MQRLEHIAVRWCVLLLVGCVTVAQAGDTLTIPLLSNERFPAQPSEKQAVVRLPADRSYARLLLLLRLSCPCGPGLGEWDYTVRFFALRPTGQLDSSGAPIQERIEIARFITPYAANRPSTWSWTWQWDITDYRFLFGDSTTVVVQYQGWTQSAMFTAWIQAIEGVPPYEVFALDQLINGSFPYGNPNDPIDQYTTGKRFRVPSTAEMVKLRITTTGHGFGGTDNAAEFAEKTHTIVVGQRATYRQHLWRDDCGWNPVYPQDGTWPLSRAGWCPGDVVHPWEQWITADVQPGQESVLDDQMEPFVNEQFSAHPSSYLITAQVLYARQPAFSTRASIVELRMPTDAPPMRRLNPTCGRPLVVVRNDGRDSIRSLVLEYAFDGQPMQPFQWTASSPLRLGDTASIELPTMAGVLDPPAPRRLEIAITRVNGQPNQEGQFHRAVSTFTDVPTVPGDSVVVYFKTNRAAAEQGLAWRLERLDDGTLIAERRNLGDEVTDVALLQLKDGCYQFRFENPAGYGLAWWATQQQLGSGALWISARGKRIFTLDGDCGKGAIFNFRVGPVPQLDVPRDTVDFGATPVGTPVRRQLTIRPATAAALHITQVQVSSFPSNLGFRIVSTQPPLPAEGLWLRSGEQLTLTLEYSPQQEETRWRTALLTITSNDYDEPTVRIVLRGTTPSALSVQEPSAVEWSASPQPASDVVRIELAQQVTEIRLLSLEGRQRDVPIRTEGTSAELDCSTLAPGVYIAIATTGARRVTVPIVVVR